MRHLSLTQIREARGRAPAAAALLVGLALLLAACKTEVPQSLAPTSGVLEAHRQETSAMPTWTPGATETPSLPPLPSAVGADQLEGACPPEGNLLGGGGFETGLEGWETRYGLLRHTVKTYAGEPGAALLVTSDAAPDGGRLAVAGRCLDLDPGLAGQVLIVEAYLLAMPETEGVALSVFLHPEAGCHGEILYVNGPPGVTSETGWTFVTVSLPIPQGTAAADFVVRAVSLSGSGRALVDRVCAYVSMNVRPSAE